MRLLLDTHAVLWWLDDDPRLSDVARQAISEAQEPMFSAGTVIEVAIKASIGKLETSDRWAEELIAEDFGLLAISVAHGRALQHLAFVEVNGQPLRDPFDRLLVAQASVEGVPLVTRDPGIRAHGVPTLW